MVNPLLDSIERFRTMLADCYWWRRLKGPGTPWDQTTALQHIYRDGLPRPTSGADYQLSELQDLRPFALIWHDLAAGFTQVQDAHGGCVKPSGNIVCQIEIDVDPGLADSSPNAIAAWADERLGKIFGPSGSSEPGLWDLNSQAGYLAIHTLQFYGYQRTEPDDFETIGDVLTAECQLSWGVG